MRSKVASSKFHNAGMQSTQQTVKIALCLCNETEQLRKITFVGPRYSASEPSLAIDAGKVFRAPTPGAVLYIVTVGMHISFSRAALRTLCRNIHRGGWILYGL
jgi:hypothetical protein